jgi:uracil phosphoribosyltransferase
LLISALTGTLPSLVASLDDKLNEHSYIVPGWATRAI